MEDKYTQNRKQRLKQNIKYYKSLLNNAIENNDEGIDFEVLYDYSQIIISKQSELIEMLE